MNSILIVEDDENLRVALTDNLEDEGYRVAAAADCASARATAGADTFDLIVLDIMLPDGDGYTLCREFRAASVPSMILMLTARSLEEDIVRGLDAGADDYLVKPYRLLELMARIRALLRRTDRPDDGEALACGAYRVDPRTREVTDGDGRTYALTRTEFDLLAFLLRQKSVVLSRDDILRHVWGKDVVVDDRTVDNFVSSLKKKLLRRPGAGFAIKTVRGIGYRLEVG